MAHMLPKSGRNVQGVENENHATAREKDLWYTSPYENLGSFPFRARSLGDDRILWESIPAGAGPCSRRDPDPRSV